MTTESDIEDLLDALAPGNVFPDKADPETVPPYIVYQQAGGVPLGFVDQLVPGKKNGRFQINVWAETRIQASAIALQAEALFINAAAFTADVLSQPTALRDEETELFGSTQDFSIWSER